MEQEAIHYPPDVIPRAFFSGGRACSLTQPRN